MAKKRRSDRLAVVHETALNFHEPGLISAQTMREFDHLCLTPVKPFGPQAIVRLRRKAHVSQTVYETAERYASEAPDFISRRSRFSALILIRVAVMQTRNIKCKHR
jgi:hypothetical protein